MEKHHMARDKKVWIEPSKVYTLRLRADLTLKVLIFAKLIVLSHNSFTHCWKKKRN